MSTYTRLYTGHFTRLHPGNALAAAATDGVSMFIPCPPNREIRLKSFLCDWQAIDQGTNVIYNAAAPNKVAAFCGVAPNINGTPFGAVADFSVAATFICNPAYIMLFQPGQFNIVSMNFMNGVALVFQITNNMANSIDVFASIIAEVEYKDV